MSDNKKYYYLKLKEDFFNSDEAIVLESMPDGYLYSNILLKLYLRSIKNEGKLMFNDKIPYDSNMLSMVTRHSVGVVEKALKIFKQLNLIEILDNGAIYMSDIQNFIGESSTEADRKREYRQKIESEKKLIRQMSGQSSDKNPPEIEIEIEINKDKEYIVHFETIWKAYPNKKGKGQVSDSCKKKIYKLGDEIFRCIERYKKSKEDWQQWQNGSTFFNSGYVDYLDENYTEATETKIDYVAMAEAERERRRRISKEQN